ncbi:response regulator [Oxynema sp. CENA135]|uniref:response regulator n=1 Tax=Oxynema sp. CENA135 TaxID=984206 RepID=UPI00190D74DC|nr:response regulator [Oxynema sp. CENA135]MBK4730545.1 response regulator [Oxynema sp. CENA135]
MTPIDVTKNILLVEDQLSHQDLILEALEESHFQPQVHIVKNGEEALDFLYCKNNHAKSPRPDLILLDLNLPKMDGRELLSIVKQDSQLQLIPIVVFTTSTAEVDVIKSYSLHANCYITKPSDLDKFFNCVRAIVEFWLMIVTPPPQ